MAWHSRWLGAIAVAAVLAAACGSGGKGTSTSTSAPPTTIDDATRTAVLDAAEAALAAADVDPATRQDRLLAFVRGHPEFADGGVTASGDVWAQFVDGGILVIASDLDDPDPGLLAATAPPAQPALAAPPLAAPTRRPRAALLDLPGSGDVFLGTSLGTHYQGYLPTIAQMFTDRNDTVLGSDTASVDALTSFSNLAVLYLNTHGVVLSRPGMTPTYVINTSTYRARDGSTDARYRADIADGSLLWFLARSWDDVGGNPVASRHTTYAITPAFVRKHWSGKFASNALVFVNSCNGASAAGAAFRQAVLDAGATVYAGWSERVRGSDAVDTAAYLFDRLLGANVFLPESPPQRPFPWQPVLANMQARVRSNRSYPFDTSYPTPTVSSHLDIQGSDMGLGMLAPSIQSLQLDETNGTLQIAGMFGDATGDALFESSKIPVTLWTAGLVVADVSGGGTSGAVKILGAYGPDSNAAPLTEWRGSATYTVQDSGLTATMSFQMHFRADVHGYRMAPGQAPVYPLQSFQQAMDSTGTYDFSGTYVSPDGFYTETWSGSGTLAPAASPAAQSGFFFMGNMDDTTWKAALTAVAAMGRHVHTVQSFADGSPPVVQDYDEDAGGVIAMSDGSAFVAAVDGSFGIAGGDRSELLPSAFGGGQMATATLHWDAMGAVNGPTPGTQRRRGPARRRRARASPPRSDRRRAAGGVTGVPARRSP